MKFWIGALPRASRISKVEDLIFTRRRLSLFGYTFLVANIATFAIRFFAGKWLTDGAGNLVYSDFLNWWLGSRVALGQNVAAVYNDSTFTAARALVIKSPPPGYIFRYAYPPTMLLLCAPLARLSYLTAFFAWMAATFCLYVLALYSILPSVLAIVLTLVPLPVAKCFYNGHTSFLMTGLLGLSLLFMRRRPYLAGACLGLLTYKPQLLLFFPLALVITRQWRVIAGATVSALLFAAATTIVFGPNAWLLFLHSSQGVNPATFLPANVDALNQTVLGMMHAAGAGAITAWIVHLAVALFVTLLACRIWLQAVPHSLKAAAFSIGVLIVTPYMLAYDLTALSVPAIFLVEDALAHGFAPGERLVLLGCCLALFLCFNFIVGPIVLIALMGLVVRRVKYDRTADRRAFTQSPDPLLSSHPASS